MEMKTRERKSERKPRETIVEAPRCAAEEKKCFFISAKSPLRPRISAVCAGSACGGVFHYLLPSERGGLFITGCKYEQNEDMTKKHDEKIFRGNGGEVAVS